MSAGDEDDTEKRLKRPTEQQTRRFYDYHPPGTPVVRHRDYAGVVFARDDDRDEITSPVDLIERPINDREQEIATRLRRDSDSPVKLIDKLVESVAKLTDRLDAQRRQERSSNKERANQLLDLINRVPGEAAATLRQEIAADTAGFARELADVNSAVKDLQRETAWLRDDDGLQAMQNDVREIKGVSTFGKWVARILAGICAPLLIYATTKIIDRSELQGEATVKLQHMEDQSKTDRATIESLRSSIEMLRIELAKYHP